MSNNRAFLYGDSLFETIKVADKCPLLLPFHYDRLASGMAFLGFQAICFDDFEEKIMQYIKAQPHDHLRLRLCFYRQGAGAYLPDSHCITACDIQSAVLPLATYPTPEKPINIGVCDDVKVVCDALSQYKTGSALRYVAAARYAQARGWSDAILLNQYNRVAEATASNIFIIKNNKLITPSISEGCVAGVMRRYLLAHPFFKEKNIEVVEDKLDLQDLANADEIWLSNAIRGVQPVSALRLPQGEMCYYKQDVFECLDRRLLDRP